MTNDRNMGNFGTANQSNLVSAHGIFNIITLENGKKYLYFVGERYLQSNKARILGYISDDNDFNSEERKSSMWEWLDKIAVIFTEEMNPKGIWEDAGEPVTAKHEKFEF